MREPAGAGASWASVVAAWAMSRAKPAQMRADPTPARALIARVGVTSSLRRPTALAAVRKRRARSGEGGWAGNRLRRCCTGSSRTSEATPGTSTHALRPERSHAQKQQPAISARAAARYRSVVRVTGAPSRSSRWRRPCPARRTRSWSRRPGPADTGRSRTSRTRSSPPPGAEGEGYARAGSSSTRWYPTRHTVRMSTGDAGSTS
jgi:hypothetical protein